MNRYRTLLLPVIFALVLPAFANPTVGSPANGASLTSPFTLSADASSCSDQPVSTMGYSLDSSSDTTVVDGTSIDTSVSASTGKHTLHVKAWGDKGASCVTDVAIDVTGSSAVADESTTSSGISVSSPANGATVSSPFNVTATASTCSGQAVSSMAYSFDSDADADTISGTSLDTSASASSGAHTLHVKSWGDQGASCVVNLSITVGSSSSAPSIPSDAVSVSSIQTLSSWVEVDDSGTDGTASGSMALVGTPTLSGDSRKFATKYTDQGGERYYVSFGDNTSSENFVYDAWVYLTSSATDVENLEMDVNQTMPNGQTVIFGFQCDGNYSTWDYTKNAGTPAAYSDKWVHSSQTCNVRNWSKNAWHHIEISYSRNSSGDVTYHAVWLDGVEKPINATVLSAFALGWAPSEVTNFEVDGVGSSGSSTLYLDELRVYRW
ncbi:MAG TPA: hypothetical protein VME18_00650 [Acidobacteriaceae bacterium]|nr:hypothetical protein [Acidobacteriaceae bacterium]